MNPDTARLQVLTEFFNPPEPELAAHTLPNQAGLALDDQRVRFGLMQMGSGRTFLLGQSATGPLVLVAKSWLTLNGRNFLVEEVPVNAIVQGLSALPLTAMNGCYNKAFCLASRKKILAPHRLERKTTSKMKFTKGCQLPKKGFVLDYIAVNSSMTNYTFQADTAYYISGATYLYETNTFEGGTVLKYATNASLNFDSSSAINWGGSAYRPVIFTAKDDNTVGDNVSGSTGNPIGYYANPALNFNNLSTPTTLSNARILYATLAVSTSASDLYIYNFQFAKCLSGFNGVDSSLYLRNNLFADVLTNLSEYGAFLDVQNTTFAGVLACFMISLARLWILQIAFLQTLMSLKSIPMP